MAPVRSHSDDEEPRPDLASHPSDQELVASYLLPRVASGEHPWKYVHAADVYGVDPADLTREFPPAVASNGSVAWYFFTAPRTRTVYGKRRARTVGAGEGCWHSESGARAVFDGLRRSRRLGRRQFFSFVKKEGGRRVRSGWIMVEIGLNGDQIEGSSDELVLCKVYRSPRVAPAAVPAPDVKAETAPAAPAPDAKKSTAAPAPARDVKAEIALAHAPDATKATPATKKSKAMTVAAAAAAASGRKRKANGKSSGAGRAVRLCTRCRVEPAESDSETTGATEEDEARSRSERTETEVLEEDSETQSDDTPNGAETVVSSGGTHGGPCAQKFYEFL